MDNKTTVRWWIGILGSLIAACAGAQLSWLGNTGTFLYGQPFPKRAGFIEDGATVTVTTQTFPIAPGQGVVAVVTTDNFQTTQEYVFTFDQNVGNNSQWYALLGPFPSGKEVKFYLRASGSGGQILYDNNNGQNYSFYARWTPRFRNGPILQWFETDYRTMTQRLPEVAMAGYSAIYLPPPSKGAGGGFSTGYNPFDRFDLGDRPWQGTVRTKYGTSQELHELIMMAHRFGIEVYADLVYNHNANRANAAIHMYPDMIPEDFHIRSSADTGNPEIDFNSAGPFSFEMLNHDLIGLADIAHEDNNNTRTGPFNLPSYVGWNGWGKPTYTRHPRTWHYYPNLTPISEDSRGLLKRWGWYLTSQFGFDGYRLDAVKHTPPGFFDFVPDADQPGSFVSNGDAMPALYAMNRNLYIFAEDYTSNPYELREFTKTGMNMLDFPLKFSIDQVFNSSGFGDLGGSFSNGWGLDSATGLAYEYGGLARDNSTSFVQSHDQGPPWSNNLAHALIMGRPARPLVYYDGNNLNPNDYNQFPKPGRFDALGNGGDTILKQLEARNRGARGYVVNRWVEQSLYIFERQVNGGGVMLVGLNLRGDTDQTRTVQTGFASGTVLRDLSGQRPDITVAANGQAVITVPSNSTAQNQNNARGYVFYTPLAPQAIDPSRPIQLFSTFDETSTLGSELMPQTYTNSAGSYATARTYQAATVRADRFHIVVRTNSAGSSAFVKFDNGLPIGGRTPLSNTAEGLTDGYVVMTRPATGRFELRNVMTGSIPDGLHVLRVRVFANTGNSPGVFNEFTTFFWMQRNRAVILDGVLSDHPAPSTTQTRTPSSNGNRLDQMHVSNDDLYLYVGLAGNVDTAENLTNGVALLLDTDPGGPLGLSDLGALEDDSGPAARLLSNARVVLAGMKADYGLGVLRRTWAGTAPTATWPGQPTIAPPVGAFAGFYKLTGNWRAFTRKRAAVAWQPRAGAFDQPVKGLEVAIPLRDMFTVNPPADLRLLAYLLNTGENGTPLASADPLRGANGGYGVPQSWVSNQFLPPQPGITGDPGTGPVTTSTYVQKPLTRMTQVTSGYSLTLGTPVFDPVNVVYRQRATITNNGGVSIAGSIALKLGLPLGVNLVNKTESTLLSPVSPYIVLSQSALPVGKSLSTVLEYKAQSASITPSVTVWSGRGLL